ncbi:MAG: ATP-grasp domain-containing protein [Ignavibacteriales bacterium]|jgi:D-alanine-D-alanine ligase|nr:MAG: ATP-grasp domain-containing protein [Ignavibacteriales bacterium]
MIKKFNVALTYNVKPDSTSKVLQDSSQSYLQSDETLDRYAEWDTYETIYAIRDALTAHHNVTLIEANEDAYEKFRKLKPEIVFNVAEGANGISREAQIPAILDMLQIPYTGSDPLTLSLCLDKSRTKEVLTYHGIRNSKFIVSHGENGFAGKELKFPLMIKPIGEGSSKGIFNSSFVNDHATLEKTLAENVNKYNQPFIVEEYLPGREFTVAVLGNGREARTLPIVEMNFNELPKDMVPIYSYEAKWILDTRENPLDIFSCPADINKELERKISELVLKTYSVLNCKDWSRIDVRLDAEGEPNIIEVNPLPGVLPDPQDNSCYPKAARTAGLDYQQMINEVLLAAAKRYGLI